jgi:hypothetical protein
MLMCLNLLCRRLQYGAGICFQARYKLGDADADAPFALLKLSGVNQLLKNEATVSEGSTS